MEPTAQAQLGPLGLWVAMTCNGFTGLVGWNRVAGWSGLAATAGALYLPAGQVMASTWGRAVLPMGRFLAPREPAEA
ncbi:hypothetical protein ACFV9W_26050 [Streptomyces sp. NPDC059897]|uniref:hypothetical protein n=1 Tax=Streptomyces sp. NPDC059897 TaxID=3346994 RepID=UPI00365A5E99